MALRADIALNTVLQVLRPLVRLLLRHGVSFPAFSAALKPVFIEVARAELQRSGRAATDSAVTLLSGVHRRDVRQLTRGEPADTAAQRDPGGLVGQVVARWLSDETWLDDEGQPMALSRSGLMSFDTLVDSVSRDVRPRALLDEMLRLGVAVQTDGGEVLLAAQGFAPRAGLEQSAALMAANLHDHAAAAVANVEDGRNLLEQAVYVDEIGRESVQALRLVARRQSQSFFKAVLAEAQTRFDQDARQLPAPDRGERVRVGIYFYTDHEDPS
jgi:hypothetical protein